MIIFMYVVLFFLLNVTCVLSIPIFGGIDGGKELSYDLHHDLKMADQFDQKAKKALGKSKDHYDQAANARFSFTRKYHFNKATKQFTKSESYKKNAELHRSDWSKNNPEYFRPQSPYRTESPKSPPIKSQHVVIQTPDGNVSVGQRKKIKSLA